MLTAMLTDYGRELDARGLAEGLHLGDYTFQVGTHGFDTSDPTHVLDVDPSLNGLVSPLGPRRPLGREIGTGTGASVVVGDNGFVTVNDLVDVPETLAGRWLQLSGSGSTDIDGTWVVSQWHSATSVSVFAPMVLAGATGVTWSARVDCKMRPNAYATDFFGRIPPDDVDTNGTELGEVGIFARVIRAPSASSLLGDHVLYAVAHHPPIAKHANLAVNHHVCVQS